MQSLQTREGEQAWLLLGEPRPGQATCSDVQGLVSTQGRKAVCLGTDTGADTLRRSLIHPFEYWLSFCCERLSAKGCVCTDGVHSSLHERVSDCPQTVDTKPGNRPHVTGL